MFASYLALDSLINIFIGLFYSLFTRLKKYVTVTFGIHLLPSYPQNIIPQKKDTISSQGITWV